MTLYTTVPSLQPHDPHHLYVYKETSEEASNLWKVTQSPGLEVTVSHPFKLTICGYPVLSIFSPSLAFPISLTHWFSFLESLLSALVWVRLPQCLLSLQVPAHSPGCSSSVELPACLSAPPTASFGLHSHRPAPSRKCGLSLPSWGLRPPAQVSHVLTVKGRHLPSFLKDTAISTSVPFPQVTAPGWNSYPWLL